MNDEEKVLINVKDNREKKVVIVVNDEEEKPKRRPKTMTDKQRRANQANGRKGGPKSVEGRQRSSQNSTTHGCWALTLYPIRSGMLREDDCEFTTFVEEVIMGLAPRDVLEHEQAKRVALAYVCLRRTDRLEAEYLVAEGTLSDDDHLKLQRPEAYLARRSGKPVEPGAGRYWTGLDEHTIDKWGLAASQILYAIREPEDTEGLDWFNMIFFLQEHHPKAREYKLTFASGVIEEFEALRRTIWANDDEALAWLTEFNRGDLARLARATGAALGVAARRILNGPADKIARLRGRATRDLIAHLAIYAKLRERTLDEPDRETNP